MAFPSTILRRLIEATPKGCSRAWKH